MNEELHSTNDELEVVNEEQRERSAELDRVNLFLEGILGNLGVAVVVVDSRRQVQLWNASATDMWGAVNDEVIGHDFMALDLGLPIGELRGPLAGALGKSPKESEFTLEAVNRKGRSFECRVRTMPLLTPRGDTYGAIVIMSEAGRS